MARGYSLGQDLRLLINNPKYSDVEILCGDDEKLHGCRAILAARSEVFDKLLYNGMKESHEKQISFPEINSSIMEIVLEYIYTGSIKEDSLTEDNIVETFCAADYFQLPDLQICIVLIAENNLEKNYAPELLSKAVNTMPLSEDNILLNLFVNAVATIPLNTIEFGRLSISALEYLLSCTHEKEKEFVTPEYEVFRYSVILAAKEVSNDAYETLMERLPTLEQIESSNSIQVGSKFITDHQKVVKELEPLIKFIDFSLFTGKILTNIIDPLEIVPVELILNAYRQKVGSINTDLNGVRGTMPQAKRESVLVWDELSAGSKLFIEDDGKVVRASSDCIAHQNVIAKMTLCGNGIFEWDIIIEKESKYSFVGVCTSEILDHESSLVVQSDTWALSSSGKSWNSGRESRYCSSFGDGTAITVHLDMDNRTCAFTINGTKYSEVSGWNLPSKLYPVVGLCYPGRIRIQRH